MDNNVPIAARRRTRIGTICLFFISLAAVTLWAEPASAQRPNSNAKSREVGLEIPEDAPVRRGQGQRVHVAGDGGADVVALLHADVGNRRLIILPDGHLKSVLTTQAPITEEPFLPATKEQIAAELKSQGFDGFKARGTARFVYVYNTSESFCKGTSRILETMYPAILAYFKRLKIPVDHPQVPLVAIMFRTEEEFQKFDPVPQGITAYYNSISNHIVMYEQSDLVEVAPELAMKQSIGTIAHEGIHQILHNIGVQQRLSRWPMWLSEGLAEYFAPTSVDQRLRWKGVGMPHDLRMHELQQYLKAKPGQSGEIVEQVVGAERLTSSGYAAAWSLTHYLASRQKEKFQNFLRDVARLGPLEPREQRAGEVSRRLFDAHFGSDYASIQKALLAHLKSLPYVDPIANQTHYVVLLDSSTMRTAGVTTSPGNARKFQEETLTRLPPTVRAGTRFQIMPFANKDSAQRYADQFLGRSN
jgi:hypothetical protein